MEGNEGDDLLSLAHEWEVDLEGGYFSSHDVLELRRNALELARWITC